MTDDISSVEQALQQGDPETALSLATEALAARPDWPRAHMLAAEAAGQLGKPEVAIEHLSFCRKVLERMPNNLEAHLNIANLYTKIGGFEGALHVLEPLPRRIGMSLDLMDAIAVNLHYAGRFKEAVIFYRKMIEIEPENLNLYNNICAAYLAGGDPGEAVKYADKWLAQVPGNTEAISFRAVALEEGGETAAAAELMNFERFVQTDVLAPPAGYSTMEAFNSALEEAVLNHENLKTPPLNTPHYHDPNLKITPQILGPKDGPIADLEQVIRQQIDAYYANLTAPQNHPFVAARPQNYDLVAWAAVLEKQGNQDAHIHFDGHLSGCYYVRIPDEVSAEGNGQEGAVAGGFEVGRPPPEFQCKRKHRHRVIKPLEGMMVLFPSYMYHQTVPFQSNERRISIAFDAMPR